METNLSEPWRLLPLNLYECLFSDMSGLRDGDLAGAEAMNDTLSCIGLELHSRAIVGNAKVCWVVDIYHAHYLSRDFFSILDSKLRWVNAIQASLNDWLKGRETSRAPVYSFWKLCLDDIWESSPEEPSEPSIPSYAVVYRYPAGNVERGGSKAYSRSSLDFRDIYIAIVLFLGAYVWIKFRAAACRGVHRRELPDKQGGSKVVYEARLKPPMWNGERVPRLDLGRFATPQEAHNKFLIAAFYYNRAGGLLDGWFQVPPMSEEERSLTGLELRAWVIGQAKKVYEEFKKKKAEAKEAALLLQDLLEGCEVQRTPGDVEVNVDFSMASGKAKEAALLLQELFEGCEVQRTPGHDEVNVGPCWASLLNSAEPQQPVLASHVENSGIGMAMLDNHGLEWTSHSFDGMHEGLALPNGHSLGSQEGSALPVSQLPPSTESGMSLNGSDQLGVLQTLVRTQQHQISLLQQQSSDQQQQSSLQQQQFSDLQQQSSLQQRQIQELTSQILQLQHQQCFQQQQQLHEPRIQNPQWPCQFCLQQRQHQDVNRGFPSFEMEMEQGMHQQNFAGLMAPPPDGGEVQEAF